MTSSTPVRSATPPDLDPVTDRTPAGHRDGVRAGTGLAWRILGVGSLLWAVALSLVLLTGSTTLIPTLVLLGSFVPPAAYAAWAFAHRGADSISIPRILAAFLVGGLIGVLGTGALEAVLIRPSVPLHLTVAFIEEGAKLAGLVWVCRGMPRRHRRDGLVLGAAVGFGFAAFESAGYALTALLTARGLPLVDLVETQLLRGLLAPLGHGLWTAILGGSLFAASRHGRLRLGAGVVATYLGVSLLHALWNAMGGVSATLTLGLTQDAWRPEPADLWFVRGASPGQVHLYSGIYWGGLLVVSAVGIVWLAVQSWYAPGRHIAGRRAPAAGTP
jgi:RsiW-degrading membrane proteinase PrsW (M82 family)